MKNQLSHIGLAIKRLQVRNHRGLDAALSPLGLTLVQWDALRHLYENPAASLHDLAQLTFQSDQALGALANRMIERGLIERVAGPGRPVRHRLTARGEETRKNASTIVEQVLAKSFAPLSTDELDAFHGYLRKLLG